eukprot:5541577-Prymnesium_polylepis.1
MRRLEPIALTDGWHDGPTAGAAIGLVVGLGDVGVRIEGRSKVHGLLRGALHGCGKLHFTWGPNLWDTAYGRPCV